MSVRPTGGLVTEPALDGADRDRHLIFDGLQQLDNPGSADESTEDGRVDDRSGCGTRPCLVAMRAASTVADRNR